MQDQKLFLKKLTVILLLTILALGQCGYYCFYAVKLYLAKESSHEQLLKQIPDNLLTKISAEGNNDIQWKEEGKEFSLKGEMYDVVKVKHEGTRDYLICLSDKNEDEIFKALDSVVKSNTDNTSDQGKQHHAIGKMSIPEWVFEVNDCNLSGDNFSYIQNKYFNYKSALYFNYIEINSPPPNFLS